MEICIPRKLTVLGLTYILLLPTSALTSSISSVVPQLISSIVITTQQMKEENDNQGTHHDDDGAIDDDAEENELGENEDFDGFDKNEDVTSEVDEDYMDALNKLTGSGNDVAQFFMGEDWDQEVYQQVQAAPPPDAVDACQHTFAAADAQQSQTGVVSDAQAEK